MWSARHTCGAPGIPVERQWVCENYEATDARGARVAVRDDYCREARASGIKDTMKIKSFGQLMKLLGFESEISHGKRYYKGVQVRRRSEDVHADDAL